MSKKRNKSNFGERTALILEELKTYEGCIIRARRAQDTRFGRVNPDIHHHTGIQCQTCFESWLYEHHGPFSGDVYHKIGGFKDWFEFPEYTLFVPMKFSKLPPHHPRCSKVISWIQNEFYVDLMVINHENIKVYNGYLDWARSTPITPPQYVRIAFDTERRNTQINNKNLFTEVFEIIEPQ